jgi:hypothetical protein
VHRLWTGGAQGQEYFLLEHRRRTGYDSELPGEGLLVWHVDDAQEDNSDEQHHLVGLLQADGLRELEQDLNRGDGGDCYPGWNDNRLLSGTTTPASTSYAGQDTGVVVARIAVEDDVVQAALSVSGTVPPDGGGEEPAGDLTELVRTVEQLQAQVERLSSGRRGGRHGAERGGRGPGERVVSAPDNLTRLGGALVERRPHPQLPDWELVAARRAGGRARPRRADLLSRRLGERLEVAVPGCGPRRGGAADHLDVRARLTPRGVMAEPVRTGLPPG